MSDPTQPDGVKPEPNNDGQTAPGSDAAPADAADVSGISLEGSGETLQAQAYVDPSIAAEAQLAEKLQEVIAETREALEKLDLPEPKKKDAVKKLRTAEKKYRYWTLAKIGHPPVINGKKSWA